MFIVCPKCFFKRTVDAKQIPVAATMATCPRCENKFRFRDPETGAYIEDICLEYEEDAKVSHTAKVLHEDSEREPIADEILGEALHTRENSSSQDGAGEQRDVASSEQHDIQSSSIEENHKTSHKASIDENTQQKSEQLKNTSASHTSTQNESEKSDVEENTQGTSDLKQGHEPQSHIQDTSDEKPLREEEVAKPKDIDTESPLLDTTSNTGKNKKSERYQMLTDDVPWEHPERYGVFGSLFQTIARVLFRAPEFFSTIHSKSSALRPALFYALLGLFQTLCLQMWISTLEEQLLEVSPMLQESFAAFSTPMAIIFSPFQAILQLVLYTSFLYLAVRITNPDKADFNLLLRVVAYAYAPTVLCIVPSIGPMLGLIWFVFNIVVGIRYALRLTWQKTFLALSPIFVLMAFFVMQIFSAFSSGM